jgi:hypothetical protein
VQVNQNGECSRCDQSQGFERHDTHIEKMRNMVTADRKTARLRNRNLIVLSRRPPGAQQGLRQGGGSRP